MAHPQILEWPAEVKEVKEEEAVEMEVGISENEFQ
jgi:hypothetical protein